MADAWDVSGFAIPSMKPIKLRGVPAGRGGLLKPSICQRGCIAPRVCFVMSRKACKTVSASFAQIWTLKSPWHRAVSRLSLGKLSIVINVAGLEEIRPKRSSNKLAPMPNMKATERDGTLGPRIPLSSAGAAGPSFWGKPPLYKSRIRLVSARSRSRSSARVSAMTSNATIAVYGVGSLSTASWCSPSKEAC